MVTAKRNLVLVYRPRLRETARLERACSEIGWILVPCPDTAIFQARLETGETAAIIVDLGTEEQGEELKKEFIVETSHVFLPEDADILIIYSSEGSTPKGWTGGKDPRFISRISTPLEVVYGDKEWSQVTEKLTNHSLQLTQYSSRHIVSIECDETQKVHFPHEARLLLRGAFSEMSRIDVSFRRQGLSGSTGCIIQPYDAGDNKLSMRFFGKLYHDTLTAHNDYRNWKEHIYNRMPSLHYPSYDLSRSCNGKRFSLFVSELAEGPGNEIITFRDMVESHQYSVLEVCEFLQSVLNVCERYWKVPLIEGSVDLANEYLSGCFSNPERLRTLESEMIGSLGLGNMEDLTPKARISKFINEGTLTGSKVKKCHGDLHADNIVPRCFEDKLIPAFIDFSKVHPARHFLADHVTLEVDLIVNSLDSTCDSDSLKLLSLDELLDPRSQSDRSLRFQKIANLLLLLRQNAKHVYGAHKREYLKAAFFRTLNVLSYGTLPFDEYGRATEYCRYLIQKLRQTSL
jgi:hypothetical protein